MSITSIICFCFCLSSYLSGHVFSLGLCKMERTLFLRILRWLCMSPLWLKVLGTTCLHVSPLVSRDGHVCYILFKLSHQSTFSALKLLKDTHLKCLEVKAQQFPDAHLISPGSRDIFQGIILVAQGCSTHEQAELIRLTEFWLPSRPRENGNIITFEKNPIRICPAWRTPLYKMLQWANDIMCLQDLTVTHLFFL